MPAFHEFVAEENISFEFEKFHDHQHLFITHELPTRDQIKGLRKRRNAVTLASIGSGIKEYLGETITDYGLGEAIDTSMESGDDYIKSQEAKGLAVMELTHQIAKQSYLGAMYSDAFPKVALKMSNAIQTAENNEDNNKDIAAVFEENEQLTESIAVKVMKAIKNGVKSTAAWLYDLISSIFSAVGTSLTKIYNFITASRGRLLTVIAVAIWACYRLYTDGWGAVTAMGTDITSIAQYIMNVFKTSGKMFVDTSVWVRDTLAREYYLLSGQFDKISLSRTQWWTVAAKVQKKTLNNVWDWTSVYLESTGKKTTGVGLFTWLTGGASTVAATTAAKGSAAALGPIALAGLSVLFVVNIGFDVYTQRDITLSEERLQHLQYLSTALQYSIKLGFGRAVMSWMWKKCSGEEPGNKTRVAFAFVEGAMGVGLLGLSVSASTRLATVSTAVGMKDVIFRKGVDYVGKTKGAFKKLADKTSGTFFENFKKDGSKYVKRLAADIDRFKSLLPSQDDEEKKKTNEKIKEAEQEKERMELEIGVVKEARAISLNSAIDILYKDKPDDWTPTEKDYDQWLELLKRSDKERRMSKKKFRKLKGLPVARTQYVMYGNSYMLFPDAPCMSDLPVAMGVRLRF